MQPLKILNNVQKARLLHSLLTTEMPGFLTYLKNCAETQIEDSDTVIQNWNNNLFNPSFWLSLAAEVHDKCRKYARELEKSASVFADQLFDGYTALYTVHILLSYVNKPETDAKFRQGVEFLFN